LRRIENAMFWNILCVDLLFSNEFPIIMLQFQQCGADIGSGFPQICVHHQRTQMIERPGIRSLKKKHSCITYCAKNSFIAKFSIPFRTLAALANTIALANTARTMNIWKRAFILHWKMYIVTKLSNILLSCKIQKPNWLGIQFLSLIIQRKLLNGEFHEIMSAAINLYYIRF